MIFCRLANGVFVDEYKSMEKKKALVVGAGVSGLAAAYALREKGYAVKVVDKNNHVGGVISTSEENGFKAESGTNTLMIPSQRVLDFITSIGLERDTLLASETAKKRFFLHGGKPVPMPMSLLDFIKTPLFSPIGKLRLMLEPLVKKFPADANPSVEEFVKARFGKEALENVFDAFFAGIYAGRTDSLAVKYAFPPFWNFEQSGGSVALGAIKARRKKASSENLFKPMVISFADGMGQMARKMAEALGDDAPILNARLTQVDFEGKWQAAWSSPQEDDCDEFDVLVLAVPAWDLTKLPVGGTLAEAFEPLCGIRGAPINSLTLGFKRSDVEHPLDGFGMLVPQKEKCSILGTLFVSSMFEGRAPSGYVTLTNYVGGMRSPELADLPDEEIVPMVLKDLERILGVRGTPVFKRMFRHKKGIPQYDMSYGERLEALKVLREKFPSVALVGSYIGGVGAGNCIENGLRVADRF